jgi:aspartyl-tRNA(Asn)/glutamyl-tRNA(Gln) amidotransferase subunit B
MNYQPIIGLEVHVELATKSKMFCGCSAEHFGVAPNTHTCPVCLGLPGALPVPNKKAVEWTVMLAQALGCRINLESHFDRKNYFYPDLPKGYQITQYEQPFGEWGSIVILGSEATPESPRTKAILDPARMTKVIRIRRVHLEEDTGKLQHQENQTLVDFNRSGVPLVEIVTEPDFRNLEEVDEYLKKLQRIIRYLDISNADMEKGSMRIEPSISIKPNPKSQSPMPNDQLPKYRVELKNINSFRFARKALEYEIERQTEILEKGEIPAQQTRGWSEAKNATVPQRSKEEAHDYRYFPEPDIPPLRVTSDQLLVTSQKIPELPDTKLARFQKQYGLSPYQANILTEDKATADGFEEKVKSNKDFSAVEIANALINKRPLAAKSTVQVNEKELEKVINQVLAENPKAVEDYKKGKVAVIGFLIGKVTSQMGQVDKTVLTKKLYAKLIG